MSAALVEELRAEVESLRELARGATATALALTAERDVLRAQIAPLLAVHDALVAAAALPGAGASGEEMVAAVRAQGAEAMRDAVMTFLDARFPGGPSQHVEGWPHDLMERVACAVAKIRAGGA